MRKILSTLCVVSFGTIMTLSTAAQVGRQGTGTTSTTAHGTETAATSDATFLKKAAEGGLAEVELGQLATQKASSEEVKKFGQRMVDDHTKANDQLKQVAAEKHIDLPQQPNAKDRATKARLERLSGEQFDKAYMDDMVKDHQNDVAEFQRESKMAKDASVKSFAQQTLPTLKDHLKQAEKIAPKQQQAERTSGQ